jgi:hypothetical protein
MIRPSGHLALILHADGRADQIDNSFVHWTSAPFCGHCGFQNLLNSSPFGFSIPHPDRAGGWNRKAHFSGQWIITLSSATPIKLSMSHPIASHSCLPIFFYYSLTCYTASAPHSLATESASNLPPTNPTIDDDAGSDSKPESTTMTTSSSSTRGASLMVKGEIPKLTDFFKRTTVSEEELQEFHNHGWLTGNVLSTIPKVDAPTVAGLIVLCFESHLFAGLGLPPSKFLATIKNYLSCSLVHFNANSIAALSSFIILCECWLGIAPDSSLFWYYYSPSR